MSFQRLPFLLQALGTGDLEEDDWLGRYPLLRSLGKQVDLIDSDRWIAHTDHVFLFPQPTADSNLLHLPNYIVEDAQPMAYHTSETQSHYRVQSATV